MLGIFSSWFVLTDELCLFISPTDEEMKDWADTRERERDDEVLQELSVHSNLKFPSQYGSD